MTDRIHALTVVLDGKYRDDDIDSIVNAIQRIRGVARVTTARVVDIDTFNLLSDVWTWADADSESPYSANPEAEAYRTAYRSAKAHVRSLLHAFQLKRPPIDATSLSVTTQPDGYAKFRAWLAGNDPEMVMSFKDVLANFDAAVGVPERSKR